MQLTCLINDQHRLAEGPLWDPDSQLLLWADIENGTLHSTTVDGSNHRQYPIPGGITSISLTNTGHYICTGEKTFLLLTRSFTEIWRSEILEHGAPDSRFNDAKVDHLGRLWAGTMHRPLGEPAGHLYCLDKKLAWKRKDSGYVVANGPAFSLDGQTMWHTDSPRRVVYQFRMHAKGRISDKQIFIQFGEDEGFPDGMTTDSEGCLWIASFSGAHITRFSPSGERLQRIDLPTSNVTSCTFGGQDYRQLFITTAKTGLTQSQLDREPLAGGIFRLDCETPGMQSNRFRIDPATLASLESG